MADDSYAPSLYAPDLNWGGDVGQALRAVREFQGRTLYELAEATRIRPAYLADLEAMRLDRLPSRPFTIGYIRAYAEALGLDAEAAVERFKADEPVLDEPLHAPVGVSEARDPRAAAIVVGVVITLAAIILWNVAQRALNANAPPPPTASTRATAKALAVPTPATVKLGAPLPAPVESTTPPLYETPGLPEAGAANGVTTLATAKPAMKPDGEPAVDPATLSPVFVAKGAVYGAPAGQGSAVTLQALKSASLIVRGAGGEIYFARQFAAGEAYRAPQLAGLTASVSEPDSFQVFVGGQSKGVLPAAQVSLNQLAGAAASPAAPAAPPAAAAVKPAP